MTSRERNILIFLLAAIAARVIFVSITGFTADDAFITFRYAENILSGEGFVYNSGEHVLGTTTPLFTLTLVMFGLIGVPVIKAALFVSLLCSGVTAVILYRFACSLRFTDWAWLPPTLYILFPRLLPTDIAGMETAMFTMFVTTALFYQHQRVTLYALAMATLATATRPEGLWLLAMLLVYNGWKNRHRIGTYLMVPLPVLLPWVVFATWYFGSPLPHSIPAKLALYSRFGTGSLWQHLLLVMGWHNPMGILLFLMAIPGTYWLYKRQLFGRLEIIWLLGMIIPLVFSSTHLFLWYISPIYPIYLLLASAALPMAVESVNINPARITRIARFAIPVVVLIMLAANYRSVVFYRDYQDSLETAHKAIGQYLAANAARDDIVAAEDIGYIGYYSRLRIIDRDGLVSPEVLPYNRSGRYLELITDFAPDWVVAAPSSASSPFLGNAVFLSQYELRERFVSDNGSEYQLYARQN